MPAIISTIDDIMAREKRDMLFVQFGPSLLRRTSPNPSRQRHLEWFDANGLRYEPAAPRGWPEGDPGVLAVYFDGPDDPQVAKYSAVFEDASGRSFAPDEYQMVIVTYKSWLANRPQATKDNPLF